MTFVAPGPASTAAFVAIVAAVGAAFVAAVHRATGRGAWAAAGLVAWLALTGLPVASGLLDAQPAPRLLVFFAGTNLAALALALSPLGRSLAATTPLWALVAFQAFRLPLELVLHAWAGQGSIPTTMTWTGSNLDVISGVTALVAAPLARRHVAAAWVANVVGLLLLLNVMRVAALSSPVPFGWQVEPPLQLAFHLPYAWIVPCCVGGALAGHVVLTRALLAAVRPSP